MEDMDRYGDYNEADEAPGGNKNIVITLLKVLIFVICFAVVGVLIFRVALFNYYPSNIKNIYFNGELTELYNKNNGDIDALTQSIRYPYDDPDKGNFFCDNLILIKDAGQLQVSLRYNSSVFDTIAGEYGVTLDPSSPDLFSFKLERVPFEEGAEPYEIGSLDYSERDGLLMYTYYKLVFDDVEFLGDDEEDWIRLAVTLNGVEGAEPYYILIYESTEDYNRFTEYELSSGERP